MLDKVEGIEMEKSGLGGHGAARKCSDVPIFWRVRHPTAVQWSKDRDGGLPVLSTALIGFLSWERLPSGSPSPGTVALGAEFWELVWACIVRAANGRYLRVVGCDHRQMWKKKRTTVMLIIDYGEVGEAPIITSYVLRYLPR